ncbi:hypothetical protein PUN28_019674 [Cardiocondyla obscurior]|uniref:Uncharacterized protein n=1 Tax=Cardiocondyla obscurior TaxID=286306 RepID=A0AAW2EA13_9HYME
MERSNDENKDIMADFGGKFKGKRLLNAPMDLCAPKIFDQRNNAQSWLNISIDAALGCRVNVFYIIRHAGKKSKRQGNIIAIHPQAAPTVCSHILELLILLAKSFPEHFVPIKSKDSKDKDSVKEKDVSDSKEESGAKNKSAFKLGRSDLPDFWDLLLKLDLCASMHGILVKENAF